MTIYRIYIVQKQGLYDPITLRWVFTNFGFRRKKFEFIYTFVSTIPVTFVPRSEMVKIVTDQVTDVYLHWILYYKGSPYEVSKKKEKRNIISFSE